MTQKLITDDQLDGIAGSKVSGAVALATTVTTNANLSGDVTSVGNTTTLGTVPVAKGGTNITSYTTGDLPYASASNVLSKLGVGTTGQVLTIAGGVPSWATPAGAATWGSITGTLSSQTDLQTVLDGKADEVSPSLSGTITLANFTKTTGDYSTYVNRPYFQTNTGTGTFVTSVGPSTATSSGAYFSGIASSDITASNFFAVGASQSATTPFAFYFGSTTSGTPTYADPTVGVKFIGRGSLTTYATINPSTAASASTDLTRLSDITVTNLSGTVPVAKGGSGQTTANDALNAFLPSQATNNGKVLGTDGTNTSWVTAGGGSGTVTSVSVATANGVSGSVANATTTPAITLTLGAITPSSVAATGTVSGTNLSGTNTGDQTITLTGDVTGTGTGSFATTLGTVPATKGGTGQTTITTGDVLYGSAANTISKLGIGSAGQVLTVAGGVPTWAAAGGSGGVTWATYTGSSAAPTITAGSKSLGLNFGAGTNTITTSATVGSFYAGSGINVSTGTADRNIVFFTGNSGSGGTTTGATMTLSSNNVNNIILCTGVQANATYTSSDFILIGNRGPAAPGAYSVGIGSFSNVGGNEGGYSVSIGANTASKSSNSIAIGNSAAVQQTTSGNSIALGTSTTIGGYNTNATVIGPGTVVPNQASGTERSYAIYIGYHNAPGAGSTYSDNVMFIGRGCTTDTTATPSNCVAIGRNVKTEFNGEMAFTGGTLSGAGTVKSSVIVSFMQTTTATPTEIGQPDYASGQSLTPTGRLNLANDSSYIFDCDIIARNTATDTETSGWNLKFVIRRGTNAASTAIVGTATKTVLAQDTGTTGWDVNVTANTTNGRPNISVTGEAAKTIRWVMNTRLTKVSG